jgi:hypothetical protein
MIEPIFTAKLRYSMELVCDSTNSEADMGLRRLHKIHKAAMKAALYVYHDMCRVTQVDP